MPRSFTQFGRLVVSVGTGAVVCAGLATSVYSDAPAGPTTAPAAIAFQPISYFEQNCARCHGVNGGAYEPGMAKRYTTDALRTKIDDMASGPAQAPIDAAAVDVTLAYHLAMDQGLPFVTVHEVAPADDGTTRVAGELTPGAQLAVTVDGKPVTPALEGQAWTAVLPAKTDPAKVRISVSAEGKSMDIGLGK